MSEQTHGRHQWRLLAAQAMPPDTWPRLARWPIVGASSFGAIGAIVGMLVGLLAYPPTAGFAVLEAGVPAAVAGGIVGLSAALIVNARRGINYLIVVVGRRIKRGSDTLT